MAPGQAAVLGGLALLSLSAVGLAAESRQIALQLFQFRPGVIDVPVGTRVTWINRDEIDHTVTAGTPDRPTGGFDFTLDGQGTTASVEFSQPGSYPYFCNRHHHMRGEIRVR